MLTSCIIEILQAGMKMRPIKNSKLDNKTLSRIHGVSTNTISKWRNADSFEDKSSQPHTIEYALTKLEELLIVFLLEKHRGYHWMMCQTWCNHKISERLIEVMSIEPCAVITLIPYHKNKKTKPKHSKNMSQDTCPLMSPIYLNLMVLNLTFLSPQIVQQEPCTNR